MLAPEKLRASVLPYSWRSRAAVLVESAEA
jgi:hypothetical protein